MHVFAVFIFTSERMRQDYFKLSLGCIILIIIIALHFIIVFMTCLPQLLTTKCVSCSGNAAAKCSAVRTHYKVCIMQWQCSGQVFCCTDSIPRGCSHICGDSLALCNLCWFVVTASELDQPSLTPSSVAG